MQTETHKYGRRKVFIEEYNDPRELMQVSEGRKPLYPDAWNTERNDFLSGKNKDLKHDEWRGGYKDTNAVKEVFEFGTKDTTAIQKADSFRLDSTATNVEKLATRQLMMYGGAVHMGRYMTGSPQCMVAVRRVAVPSRIIELAIDVDVSCYVNPDDIRIVGMACLGAIARLESTGYKVKAHALSTTCMDNRNIIGCDLLVKNSSEILNPSRILFPLQDPAFFRTIMFGWMIRNPNWDDSSGMGVPVKHEIDDLDKFYRETYGYDKVFNIQKLVDWMPSGTELEKAIAVRDKIIEQVTA